MNPLFIKPSVESVVYLRREKVINNPVNLSNCGSIEKNQYRWYPDNEGIPAIKFNGVDVTWVYEKEEERDAEFERIINNKF